MKYKGYEIKILDKRGWTAESEKYVLGDVSNIEFGLLSNKEILIKAKKRIDEEISK